MDLPHQHFNGVHNLNADLELTSDVGSERSLTPVPEDEDSWEDLIPQRSKTGEDDLGNSSTHHLDKALSEEKSNDASSLALSALRDYFLKGPRSVTKNGKYDSLLAYFVKDDHYAKGNLKLKQLVLQDLIHNDTNAGAACESEHKYYRVLDARLLYGDAKPDESQDLSGNGIIGASNSAEGRSASHRAELTDKITRRSPTVFGTQHEGTSQPSAPPDPEDFRSYNRQGKGKVRQESFSDESGRSRRASDLGVWCRTDERFCRSHYGSLSPLKRSRDLRRTVVFSEGTLHRHERDIEKTDGWCKRAVESNHREREVLCRTYKNTSDAGLSRGVSRMQLNAVNSSEEDAPKKRFLRTHIEESRCCFRPRKYKPTMELSIKVETEPTKPTEQTPTGNEKKSVEGVEIPEASDYKKLKRFESIDLGVGEEELDYEPFSPEEVTSQISVDEFQLEDCATNRDSSWMVDRPPVVTSSPVLLKTADDVPSSDESLVIDLSRSADEVESDGVSSSQFSAVKEVTPGTAKTPSNSSCYVSLESWSLSDDDLDFEP